MKRYIREVFVPEYARNFNKGLSAADIKFYGKIHFGRSRSDNKLNMHCHLIVSRKDQSNKIKISPLTNHRNTRNGVIKGGFDHTTLFENAEKGFDKLFGYNRQLTETFEYCNTMKNGSIVAKLQMQEQELKISDQSVDIAINRSIVKSINQSTAQSNSHSNEQSGVSSLFSIFPSANDSSQDPRDEQNLLKLKKKKKRRGLRL